MRTDIAAMIEASQAEAADPIVEKAVGFAASKAEAIERARRENWAVDARRELAEQAEIELAEFVQGLRDQELAGLEEAVDEMADDWRKDAEAFPERTTLRYQRMQTEIAGMETAELEAMARGIMAGGDVHPDQLHALAARLRAESPEAHSALRAHVRATGIDRPWVTTEEGAAVSRRAATLRASGYGELGLPAPDNGPGLVNIKLRDLLANDD